MAKRVSRQLAVTFRRSFEQKTWPRAGSAVDAFFRDSASTLDAYRMRLVALGAPARALRIPHPDLADAFRRAAEKGDPDSWAHAGKLLDDNMRALEDAVGAAVSDAQALAP